MSLELRLSLLLFSAVVQMMPHLCLTHQALSLVQEPLPLSHPLFQLLRKPWLISFSISLKHAQLLDVTILSLAQVLVFHQPLVLKVFLLGLLPMILVELSLNAPPTLYKQPLEEELQQALCHLE